jgi:hypothetical protein
MSQLLADEKAARIAELEAKIADCERQRREHDRQLCSRIVMSKKEEIAREAMIEWLEEEIEILEAKLDALK